MVLLKWYDYFTLLATALIPAVAAILIHYVSKRWKWFQQRNYWVQQVLIGIVFSWFALCAFYFGVDYSSIDISGYKLEVTGSFGSVNAIPLVAGLVFGGPSGLIAGTTAGIYRLLIFRFGTGDYLRAAEVITVFLSGGLAWLLKATLFDNKKPKWFYGFIIGLLIETIHMLLLFTVCIAQADSTFAYGVIRACDIYCFLTVALSIIVSLAGIALLEKEKLINRVKGGDKRIATKIQKWLALTFVVGIVFTFTFTFWGNWQKSNYDTTKSLKGSNDDVCELVEKNKNIVSPKSDITDQPTYLEHAIKSGAYYLTCSHRIGRNGFAIALDFETQKMVSLPTDLFRSTEYKVDDYIGRVFYLDGAAKTKTIRDYEEGKIYEVKIVDIVDNTIFKCYMRYRHISIPNRVPNNGEEVITFQDPNFIIASFLSKTEATIDMGLTIRLTEYIELLIFIAIFAIIYIFIKKVVVLNVYKINKSLDKITSGNLNVKVNVRSNQEFSDLSDDINQTVDTLKHFIEEANKRIDAELEYARKIQQNSLPVIFPTTNLYDLYALMNTAKQVGGDFYDFFPVGNDKLFFLIADVSGKGIPAAMFMMRAKTLVKSLIQTNELSLDVIITEVNEELNIDNESGMFVTGWFGMFNILTGELEFVNCGHCRPLFKHNNSYRYLEMHKNCVLGVMPGMQFKLNKLHLESNDILILYTDGVTEATNTKKQLYGEPRLLEFVNKNDSSTSRDLLNEINNEIEKFQKGAEQADDITLLAIKYKPKK